MIFSPEQTLIGRRNFLKAAAALPALGGFAVLNHYTGNPVRCGIIGTGGEGCVLLRAAPTNMLDVVALADIRPDSQQAGRQLIAERWGRTLADRDVYGMRYEDLLQRDDIEAVIIATPLWLHAEMTIKALEAGKHVFCEKTMAYTIEECERMLAAARRTGRVLQIGHQRFYNPLYQAAYQMIQDGKLGDIYHIRMVWHRNTDWRRPCEPAWEQAFGPLVRNFGYDSVEHLVNWRLYHKYSKGLMTELCSHQAAISNWIAGSLPRSVVCTGGLFHYTPEKGFTLDQRECDDHNFAIFEYPKNLTVTFSSILTNKSDHYYEHIMGTKGTLFLSGETTSLYFPEPGAEAESAAKPESGGGEAGAAGPATGGAGPSSATQLQVAAAKTGMPVARSGDSGADRAADAAGGGWGAGRGLGEGDVYEGYAYELKGFAQAVRNGLPCLCDGKVGLDAAIVVLQGYESRQRGGERVTIEPSSVV